MVHVSLMAPEQLNVDIIGFRMNSSGVLWARVNARASSFWIRTWRLLTLSDMTEICGTLEQTRVL